jgi:multidrug transporter EmrE-like cation transporter
VGGLGLSAGKPSLECLITPKKKADTMNGYLALGIAIIAEVIATTALKSSDSFTKLVPSLISIAGYGTALYLLTVTMKSIPTGVTYAIWSGLGIVLISITSFFFHHQKIDLWGMVGMALIIAGVVVLNLFSNATMH